MGQTGEDSHCIRKVWRALNIDREPGRLRGCEAGFEVHCLIRVCEEETDVSSAARLIEVLCYTTGGRFGRIGNRQAFTDISVLRFSVLVHCRCVQSR